MYMSDLYDTPWPFFSSFSSSSLFACGQIQSNPSFNVRCTPPSQHDSRSGSGQSQSRSRGAERSRGSFPKVQEVNSTTQSSSFIACHPVRQRHQHRSHAMSYHVVTYSQYKSSTAKHRTQTRAPREQRSSASPPPPPPSSARLNAPGSAHRPESPQCNSAPSNGSG